MTIIDTGHAMHPNDFVEYMLNPTLAQRPHTATPDTVFEVQMRDPFLCMILTALGVDLKRCVEEKGLSTVGYQRFFLDDQNRKVYDEGQDSARKEFVYWNKGQKKLIHAVYSMIPARYKM